MKRTDSGTNEMFIANQNFLCCGISDEYTHWEFDMHIVFMIQNRDFGDWLDSEWEDLEKMIQGR